MILDTSFLVDVMNGDPSALSQVDRIEADNTEQVVPAMTLQELYIGVGASELPERERRKIASVVEARPVLPTSAEIARKAGTIDGQLRSDGQRINVGDATIGATGVVREEPVLTGDPEHFERIPGLDVVGY
jgi:predicted nucleic acid-binding protein